LYLTTAITASTYMNLHEIEIQRIIPAILHARRADIW